MNGILVTKEMVEEALVKVLSSRIDGLRFDDDIVVGVKELDNRYHRLSTPMRPKVYKDFEGINRFGCLSCDHNEIFYSGQKYCSVCGQRIDWEGYKR